jgi:superoxide dismutase
MTLHHKKHHQTYVTGLNAAEEAYAKPLSVAEKVALQPAMKFNGGGMSYSFAIIIKSSHTANPHRPYQPLLVLEEYLSHKRWWRQA